MRFLIVFLSVLTVALTLSSAAVGRGDKFKSQENEARAACLLGNYRRGTEILVRLYIQTNRAVYLFNQGRCYEQNHRWEEAIDRFREFLRKSPNLEDEIKTLVTKHIAECEASLPKAAGVQAQHPEPVP
jgi:hypothetical protein